jgi:hypothetical protein
MNHHKPYLKYNYYYLQKLSDWYRSDRYLKLRRYTIDFPYNKKAYRIDPLRHLLSFATIVLAEPSKLVGCVTVKIVRPEVLSNVGESAPCNLSLFPRLLSN